MRDLEWVYRSADSVQAETREVLHLQIAALTVELDRLAAGMGTEATDRRRELEQAIQRRELLQVGPSNASTKFASRLLAWMPVRVP